MTEDELRAYIAGLRDGERVIETSRSALWNKKGTIYHNSDGYCCVMWDGPEKMGTGVTGGTRRIEETIPEGFRAVMCDSLGRRGPMLERQANGRWGFPNPPILTSADKRRIVASVDDGQGLDQIDSKLIWRILEINSESP